jgi:hypothetical protein
MPDRAYTTSRERAVELLGQPDRRDVEQTEVRRGNSPTATPYSAQSAWFWRCGCAMTMALYGQGVVEPCATHEPLFAEDDRS